MSKSHGNVERAGTAALLLESSVSMRTSLCGGERCQTTSKLGEDDGDDSGDVAGDVTGEDGGVDVTDGVGESDCTEGAPRVG